MTEYVYHEGLYSSDVDDVSVFRRRMEDLPLSGKKASLTELVKAEGAGGCRRGQYSRKVRQRHGKFDKKGDPNLPPYKFNSPNKADGFNLDVIQLRIDKPLDETDWAAGYRMDLWFGPDANALGTTSTGIDAGADCAAGTALSVAVQLTA